MKTPEFIQLLKDKDITLCIAEQGYGMAFSDDLMSYSGASEVVYSATSYYSKDYVPNDMRAISLDYVDHLWGEMPARGSNMEIVTSFQAGTLKDAHGYVLIAFNDVRTAYHVTIGYGEPKMHVNQLMMHIIKNLLVRTLTSDPTSYTFHNMIDGAWVWDENEDEWLFAPTKLPPTHGPYIIDTDKKWRRVADWIRGKESVGVVKGSFNPIHEGHKQLIYKAEESTKNILLSVTGATVEGKYSDNTELFYNAYENATRHPVMVDTHLKMYIHLINYLDEVWVEESPRQYVFPMGMDVFKKLDVETLPMDRVNLEVFTRNVEGVNFNISEFPGLSSSQIRAQG